MNIKNIAAGITCMTAALAATAQTETTDPKAKNKYGETVVALAPILLSENGVAGVGLSYERTLDKSGIVAFYCPVSMVMNTNSQNRLGTTQNYPDPMFYLMPGVKIYPTGNQGLAKYAIGPSLVIAGGSRTEMSNNIYPYSSYMYLVTRQHTVFGMMVNQSLNINPTPHLYVGSEFGLGFSYVNRLDGVNQPMTGLVQFSFKIGYRF